MTVNGGHIPEVIRTFPSDEDSNVFDRLVTESATAWDSQDSQGPSNTEYWSNVNRQAKQAMWEMTGNDDNLSGDKYPDIRQLSVYRG